MLTHKVNEDQVLQIIQELSLRKQTVGFAESCTGGSLSSALAAVSGASQVFKGSVIAYANEIKIAILGVHSETLFEKGAVSEEVAREMALGAQKVLHVDWAVSVTGIAGPSGGSELKPVGTVFVSVIGPENVIPQLASTEEGGMQGLRFNQARVGVRVRTEKKLFSGDRATVQKASVETALKLLIEEILKESAINNK